MIFLSISDFYTYVPFLPDTIDNILFVFYCMLIFVESTIGFPLVFFYSIIISYLVAQERKFEGEKE